MKLLRTIQLDSSDRFVFEQAAMPGEWAVSGAFAFLNRDIAALRGKDRTAFRAGFLGLESLGRSTLVQIVETQERDSTTVVELLAAQLAARFGAPDIESARAAATEEIAFAASLCNHPTGVIIAVTRTFEQGSIREAFRTLRPNGQSPSRAFNFVEVIGEGETTPEDHFDLAELGKGERI